MRVTLPRVYNPDEACSLNLVDHGRGYLGILLSCMIAEMAIIWLSMRGGILYTEPRESMQYVLYVRLGKGHPPWAGGYSGSPPQPPSCVQHSFSQQRTGRLPAPTSGPGVGRLQPEGQILPTVCFF